MLSFFEHRPFLADGLPVETFGDLRLLAVVVIATIAITGLVAVLLGSFIMARRTRLFNQSLFVVRERLSAVACAFDTSQEGIFILDRGGCVVSLNPAAVEMFGYSQAEVKGRAIHPLIHHTTIGGQPCESAVCSLSIVFTCGSGGYRNANEVCWRRDGTSFAAEITVVPFSAAGTVVVVHDISERHRLEDKHLLAARVFESSHDCIVITDRQQAILSVNPSLLATFGYSAEELLGHSLSTVLLRTMNRGERRSILDTLDEQGSWEGEVIGIRKGGDIFPAWVRLAVTRNGGNRVSGFIGIVSDMSEKKAALDRIEYLSRYDPLTGLPNRHMIKDYFRIACGTAEQNSNRMALICCNLDNFKYLNDTLGHELGDDLLRDIGKKLRGCIAIGTGDIVSRSAGDEFLILLVDVPVKEAADASVRAIRAVISVPVELGGYSIAVTASLGISRYPDDGNNFDILYQKADAAVYHAKMAGRNTVRYFVDAMIDYATERLILMNDLRTAIDNNQFIVYYQPLIDLQNGGIVGAEALVRWQSPQHGFMAPGRFIPIAEESGLIVPIGFWVLREVCRQGRQWRDAGFPNLRLAVNISAIQVRSPNFVEAVARIFEQSGMPPEWIELELTESVLISDVDQTLDVIKELKGLGVRLAIDDFGTGYSSLSYLQKLNTDELKIDRSFVSSLTDNPESAAIVTTIIQMAETMNMSTLAEGVETEDQARYLKRLGCRECQGYLFGRPVPADEFALLVRPHNIGLEAGA